MGKVSLRSLTNNGPVLLLVAALVSILAAFVGGYVTRRAIIDASSWAIHADEVKLAIDECRVVLARGDREGLKDEEDHVGRLVADDPRQEQSVARAAVLTDRGSREELDDLFVSMRDEEDRLMAGRADQIAAAERRSFETFVLGAAFAAVLGVSSLVLLRTQMMQRLRTEQELRESEERFHRLVDAVTDYAIVMLDAEGHVATWNAGAKTIKGYDADEIIGKHFSIFYSAEDRAAGKPQQILDAVRRDGRYEAECWRVRKDGSVFCASVTITALRDAKGKVAGFAKVTWDLTRKRHAEENERRLAQEQLAREASETARHEMERVNRAKDEFLATMSHELRTPLNAISGWAAILRSSPLEEAKWRRGVEVIDRNAHSLLRLVNDLLDVSRIISGKLRLLPRRTDVSPAVRAAVDVIRPAADAKGVRLVVDIDANVGAAVVDADRLQQIVWNLLSNAVRFTARGGCISVRVNRVASDVVISVEDTGVGIPAKELPYIFERFRQVDSSTTRAHGGLGLGLAIVRHLAEAHGGSVAAFSAGIGRGATFSVNLPIRAIDTEAPASTRTSGSAPAQEAPAPGPSLRDLHVLVVDDDRDSVDLLRLVLEEAGAKVTTATAAPIALEAPGPFEVIISDIGMPGIDGYSFIRQIRSRVTGANVPAIALTAYATEQDRQRAMHAGYQEHLAKPVDRQTLIVAVRDLASTRSPAA